jgi:hypothetical protein
MNQRSSFTSARRTLSRSLSPIIAILALAAVSTSQANGTTILQPTGGVHVAVADMGFYDFQNFAHGVLAKPSQRLRKVLDLSGIDEQAWQRIGAAEVSLFLHAEDASGDGLDEHFEIVVNGHVNVFATEGLRRTGMGWFGHYLPTGWFDFAINADQLVRGTNVIVVQRSDSAQAGDDVLTIGIDIFEDRGRSWCSFDRGSSWSPGPLNRPLASVGYPDYGHYGELMIRLNLYDDATRLGRKGFSHDDLLPLPAVDLNPPVKLLPTPSTFPASVALGGEIDRLENGWMRLQIGHAKGLALEEIIHKPMRRNVVKEGPTSLFALEVDGRHVQSAELEVTGREQLATGSSAVKVVYFLRDPTSEVEANLSLRLDNESELTAGLYLKNAGTAPRGIKVAFPIPSVTRRFSPGQIRRTSSPSCTISGKSDSGGSSHR